MKTFKFLFFYGIIPLNYLVNTMKKMLVVVDYQNDFVTGRLGFPEAIEIEDNILSLIDEFKKNSDFVCFTMDTHDANYPHTVEGEKLPITHCIKGTWGWELTPRVKEASQFLPIFEKYSFPSLELGNYIRGLSPMLDEIWLCGLVSDICVISNAIMAKAAAKPNCKIKVIANATSSNSMEEQDKCFAMLEHLHVDVIK